MNPVERFLELEIKQTGNELIIDQNKYFKKNYLLYTNSKLVEWLKPPCNLVSTYLISALKMELSNALKNFQKLLGLLTCLAEQTRPDLSYAVNKLAKVRNCATLEHFR